MKGAEPGRPDLEVGRARISKRLNPITLDLKVGPAGVLPAGVPYVPFL